MRRNNLTLILFVFIGLLAGTIIGELLSQISALAFLTKSTGITLEPKVNLQAFKFDLYLEFRLNLITILGIATALWLYRKF